MSLFLASLVMVTIVSVLSTARMAGGRRSSGLLLVGLLSLAAVGGAAFFLLSPAAAPPAPVVAPETARPAPRVPGTDAPPPAPPIEHAVPGTEGLRAVKVSVNVLDSSTYDADTQEDEEGVAAPGARVDVLSGPNRPGATPLLTATTGDDGTAQLSGVPTAKVLVRVTLEGYAPSADWVDVDETEVDFLLLRGGVLTGTVLSRVNGAPLPGATVTAGDAVSVDVAADGSFRLEPVEIGGVSVVAAAPGHASVMETIDIAAAGDEVKHEFRLALASVISGVVLGPDGSPAAKAKVTLEALRSVPMAGEIATDTVHLDTDEAGAFRHEAAPTGLKLRLSASSDKAIALPHEEAAMAPGEIREGIVLRMLPGAFVVVRVLDPQGKPVKGAQVAVTAEDAKEEGGMRAAMMSVRMRFGNNDGTATDEEGKARIGPLAPGAYEATAQMQDYLTAKETLQVEEGAELPVAFTLDAGSALRGIVVDDLGQPVVEANVTARRFAMGDFVSETRKSNETGAFLIGGLDGKSVSVVAEKDGYVRTSMNNIKPGADSITVTLQRGGSIVGTALSPEGEPVTQFEVVTERTDQKTSPNPMDPESMRAMMGMGDSQNDEGGHFRVGGLASGVYRVIVRSAGFAPGRVEEVQVTASRETEIVVKLSEGFTVEGVVVSAADGTPVAGARVSVQAPGLFGQFDMDFETGDENGEDAGNPMTEGMRTVFGGRQSGATTDGEGRFVLKGLEEGTVNLKVGAKGYAPTLAKNIKVPASGDVRVEIKTGGIVMGKVTDAEGAPAKGMMVMLQKLPATMKMATTGDDGSYKISGLGGGSYLFYVMDNPQGMMGGGGLNLRSESVRVEEGKTIVKDYRLGSGIKVTGKVTRGTEPVSGAMVMLTPASAGGGGPMGMLTGPGAGFAMGSTKEDGTYEITGVKPGRYTVMVQTGMTGGGGGNGDPLEIPAGATVVRRDVALPTDSLKGIVVNESGEPVTGAQIMAVKPGTDLSSVSDLGSVFEAMGGQGFSDDDGRFHIENIRPGTYTLRVTAAGHGTTTLESVTAGPGTADVRVVVAKGQEVAVRVIDGDGNPVSGAGLYLRDGAGNDLSNMESFDAVRTDAAGKAVINAPSGQVTIEAMVTGHAPGSVTVSLPSSSEVTIRLVRGGTVRVRVLDGSEAPISGVAVVLLDADGKPLQMRLAMENIAELLGGVATDGSGVVERGDLPAGSYKVRATLDTRTAEASFKAVAGEVVEVTLRL